MIQIEKQRFKAPVIGLGHHSFRAKSPSIQYHDSRPPATSQRGSLLIIFCPWITHQHPGHLYRALIQSSKAGRSAMHWHSLSCAMEQRRALELRAQISPSAPMAKRSLCVTLLVGWQTEATNSGSGVFPNVFLALRSTPAVGNVSKDLS